MATTERRIAMVGRWKGGGEGETMRETKGEKR